MADIDQILGEAEVYENMGLTQEALELYRELDKLLPADDPRRAKIDERLKELDPDAAAADEAPLEMVEGGDENREDIAPLIEDAQALKKAGKYKEAAAEYNKTLHLGYPVNIVAEDLVECLVKGYNDFELDQQLHNLLHLPFVQNEQIAEAAHIIGVILGKHGLYRKAMEFLLIACSHAPDDKKYQRQISVMIAEIANTPRYAYLVSTKLVTLDQVKKAVLAMAKQQKSTEWVMINRLGIDKEALLTALSRFYNCPYEVKPQPNPELKKALPELKQENLSTEGWVPWARKANTFEVLLEDPKDERLAKHIRSQLGTGGVGCRLAVREDIDAVINKLFVQSPGQNQANLSPEELNILNKPIDVSFLEEIRTAPRGKASRPDFLSAQLIISDNGGMRKEYLLQVQNHSRKGLGLLVNNKDLDILDHVKVNDTLKDTLFFAGWAMLKVDVKVRHITPVEQKGRKKSFVLGVFSEDLV